MFHISSIGRHRRHLGSRHKRLQIESLEVRRLLDATAEIHGTVWNDTDGDSLRDTGEHGLANWTVYRDENANGAFDAGEPTTTSGPEGEFAWVDLPSGSYRIGAIEQPPWQQTYPEISASLSFIARYQDNTNGINGLNGAEAIAVSPDGKHVYAASILENSLAVFERDWETGALSFLEYHHDGSAGVDGLSGAHWVAISPAGDHVYVSGRGDDAVALFSRDSQSGLLTFVERVKDGVGGVDGLNGASVGSVSPDGQHFYVAARFEDSVAAFQRNPTTGQLTFLAVYRDGVAGIDGLNEARGLVVSPDGQFVHVASLADNAVAVFERDEASGLLSFVQVVKDNTGGVNGLDGAIAAFVSPDGDHLYVASIGDDAVAVFSRHQVNGSLTFVEMVKDGVSSVDGLDGAIALSLNATGKLLYVAGYNDDSVSVFHRDASTGELSFAGKYANGVAGTSGLNGAHGVSVTPDGRHVYVGAYEDDSVVAFRALVSTHLVTIGEGEVVTGIDFGEQALPGANQPPVLEPIALPPPRDVGVLVSFVAVANDPDAPAGTLTYSLDAGAPSGATIDPVTGLFEWTPSLADGPGTYAITVRVTDNGEPSLDDEIALVIEVLQPGDVDLDGDVDFDDFLALQIGFGTSAGATRGDGDLDGDGDVDFDDFLLLQINFGAD